MQAARKDFSATDQLPPRGRQPGLVTDENALSQPSQRTAGAEPPFVAANISHSIPTDHKLDRIHNAHRRRMAQRQVAAAEVLPNKRRNIQLRQRRPGASDSLIDILHRMSVLCKPVPVAHKAVRMRVVQDGVRNSWRPARHRPGNRFRSRHERGQMRYRRHPAPHRQIAARLPKLAMTTEGQAQEKRCGMSW